MIMIKYLFSSSGQWIAFKRDEYVFDTNGNWIGWIPWNDGDVCAPNGEYLGTITQNDRLYRFYARPNKGYLGYPGYPSYLGYPGYPGYASYSPLPPLAEDIEELRTV